MKTTPSQRRSLILVASILLVAAGSLVFLAQRGGNGYPSSVATPDSKPERDNSSGKVGTKSGEPRQSPRQADRLLAAEDARTDVSLSRFPQNEYQQLRSPGGKAQGAPAGDAYIHVPSAGRRIAMEANQLGEFPTVETKLKDTVGIRLALDGVKPGTPVRVVIMDGGSFPAAEGVSQVLKAADWSGVAFEYTTSANIGTHRVLVQALGQPSRILDFKALESKDS